MIVYHGGTVIVEQPRILSMQIILENGYPWKNGELGNKQAEYATANALRFWLSERNDNQFYNMTDLNGFTDTQLRNLASTGKITKKVRVSNNSYIPALQFAVELLIKARQQTSMGSLQKNIPKAATIGMEA